MSAEQSSEIGVEPARVAAWLGEQPAPQLVDVRELYEHEAGHIAGSRHIELTSLPSQAATLDADRPVIFYCRVGSRSTMAAQALRAAGIEAYSMDGGLLRWAAEQRLLEPADGRVAEH